MSDKEPIMRFTWRMATNSVTFFAVAWIGVASGQAPSQPRGGGFFPKAANLATDPPSAFLEDFASIYQALKAGRAPPKLGSPFIMAQGVLADPRRCTVMHGSTALMEFSTSFQRLAGRTESTLASNREIVLTSIARYACPDADNEAARGRDGDSVANPVARVPGYEMMAITKGTFAETIAPRKRAVLAGMSNSQATALQQFGDVTQRFRTDPGAASVPGTVASRMADLQELKKLPPEERKQAMDELNARYAKEQPAKAQQAQGNEIAKQIVSALSATGEAAPKPLAFLELLQPGEAYVDFYKYYVREGEGFGPLHYLAVISDIKGSRLLRLGPAEPIDTTIAGYIANPPDRMALESTWKGLQRLVVEPLLAALPADSKAIWVSPDSDLFNLPFASLMLDLRAELAVAIVPSAYDFSRLQSVAASPPTGKALLVGDLIEQPTADTAMQAVPLAEVTSGFDGMKLQVQTLRGPEASRPVVLASMKDAQYMLFSTHGRWANAAGTTTDDAFGSAGIELWADAPGVAGSVLTAADVVRIDLSQSDLVVLLACDTAKGQPVNGQGSLGFQSAFMAAGARSLLVALWRVPADASKQLIQTFYTGLFKQKLSRAEALKQAQAALRSQPNYADPWNWGGWVLVGDPRPVMQ
jgi:hypothetical protein